MGGRIKMKNTGKTVKFDSQTYGPVNLEVWAVKKGIYRLKFPNMEYWLNMGMGSANISAETIKKWFGLVI